MRKQSGFSLIELLIVVAIILIIVAIAIPSLNRARIQANETAAAATVRSIGGVELSYMSAYPTVGYSQSLTSLGPNGAICTAPGAVDSTHACLLDGTVACAAANGPCPKQGYNYFLGGTTPAAGQPAGDFVVSAGPISMGTSGGKDFCSVPDGVIRQTKPGVAAVPLAVPGESIVNCANPANYVPAQ
jgi:prepilin-type N-terminal cleavage/methylation domain-containing protein